ncbi:MAG TPA: hypothetical protein VJK72_05810 [Candidatus Nanoarchaeia archaeon]|nr:hypothetical protein [Candidatus Nanoarchaeia archaeon]
MVEGKKGLFPPAPAENIDVNALRSRLRLLEEKTTNLNRKIELLESNLINSNKKRGETVRALDADLLEVKHEMSDFRHKIGLIISELKLTAGKDELNSMKSYLDMWNPARFATRDEVEKMLGTKRKNE